MSHDSKRSTGGGTGRASHRLTFIAGLLDAVSNLLAGQSPEHAERASSLAGGCLDLAADVSDVPERSVAERRPPPSTEPAPQVENLRRRLEVAERRALDAEAERDTALQVENLRRRLEVAERRALDAEAERDTALMEASAAAERAHRAAEREDERHKDWRRAMARAKAAESALENLRTAERAVAELSAEPPADGVPLLGRVRGMGADDGRRAADAGTGEVTLGCAREALNARLAWPAGDWLVSAYAASHNRAFNARLAERAAARDVSDAEPVVAERARAQACAAAVRREAEDFEHGAECCAGTALAIEAAIRDGARPALVPTQLVVGVPE